MQKKGAMELSVSMIVILILSIVIFAGGLYMVKQFFSFAKDTQESISAQTKKEVENRLIQSGEPVSIPFSKAKVLIGESNPFSLGILNSYQQPETFTVEMSFSNAFDTNNPSNALVDPDKAYINENWIFAEIPPIESLKRNQVEVIPLTVQVGSTMAPNIATQKGVTYVFNVCVYPLKKSGPTGLCAMDPPIPKDRIRGELHGQKIAKMYVEVP